MEAQATLSDAIRKTCEVYAESLGTVMKALADLPRESGELHRRALEQWLGLARINKDSFLAAVNRSFDTGSANVGGSWGLRTRLGLCLLGPTPWRSGSRTGSALLRP
jgi:hypothetical protein